jgi:hypothetical protein
MDFLQHSTPKDPNVRRIMAGVTAAASFTAALTLAVTGHRDGMLGLAAGAFFFACPMLWVYVWFYWYDWHPETNGGQWMADSFSKMLVWVVEDAGYFGFGLGFFGLAFYIAPWWTAASAVLLMGSFFVALLVELKRRMLQHEREIKELAGTPL